LSRLQFASLVEDFMVCDESGTGVVMTKSFDLGDAQLVRKIDPGELFEVLEGPTADPVTDMKRARGRALRDGATGWVSILNNKGGALLKPAAKPMMTCTVAVPLLKAFDSTSPELRQIEVGQVFELIRGPQEASRATETNIQGKAAKDDAAGWIMLSDSSGNSYASSDTTFYSCRSPTALTDSPDIKNCKALRKIEVGEVLEAIDPPGDQAPTEDNALVMDRMYLRAAKDNKEGWVTIKGSRGTVFLEAETQYKLEKQMPLRTSITPDGRIVRQMAIGEIFKPIGQPKEHTPPTAIGMHVRDSQGDVGWVVYSSADISAPLEKQ